MFPQFSGEVRGQQVVVVEVRLAQGGLQGVHRTGDEELEGRVQVDPPEVFFLDDEAGRAVAEEDVCLPLEGFPL